MRPLKLILFSDKETNMLHGQLSLQRTCAGLNFKRNYHLHLLVNCSVLHGVLNDATGGLTGAISATQHPSTIPQLQLRQTPALNARGNILYAQCVDQMNVHRPAV